MTKTPQSFTDEQSIYHKKYYTCTNLTLELLKDHPPEKNSSIS